MVVVTAHPTSPVSYIQFARGPMLILGVMIPLIYPYVCEFCSQRFLINLIVGLFGLLWFIHDLSKAFENALKAKLNHMVESFVLDDFMRKIFDPETGLIACLVGSVVGASTMYGLHMTQDQRLRLMKSSFGLQNDDITRTILLEPGGCKTLLPNEIKNWLSTDDNVVGTQRKEINVDSSSNSSDNGGGGGNMVFGDQSIDLTSSDCDETDIDVVFDEETINNAARKYSNANRNDIYHDSDHRGVDQTATHGMQSETNEQQQAETSMHDDIDPLAVFSKIVREMAVQQIKPYAESFPTGTMENVGVVAATVFVAQLILRRSSKRHLVLGRICAVLLSSIAGVSFGTVLTREAILGKVHDKKSLVLACKEIASRAFGNMQRKVLSSKTKSFLAMAILLLISRRKHSNTAGTI
jgi:hypothetical protein